MGSLVWTTSKMLFFLPLLLCLAAAAATDQQQRKGLPESACIKLCEVTNKFCLNSCRPGPLGLACQGECGFKLGVCQGACIGFLPRQQETPAVTEDEARFPSALEVCLQPCQLIENACTCSSFDFVCQAKCAVEVQVCETACNELVGLLPKEEVKLVRYPNGALVPEDTAHHPKEPWKAIGGLTLTPYHTQFVESSKHLLRALKLDNKRLVRDKSVKPSTETIKWSQISHCLWECKEEYLLVDYYLNGDKSSSVVKVFVAKEAMTPPDEFKTSGTVVGGVAGVVAASLTDDYFGDYLRYIG